MIKKKIIKLKKKEKEQFLPPFQWWVSLQHYHDRKRDRKNFNYDSDGLSFLV